MSENIPVDQRIDAARVPEDAITASILAAVAEHRLPAGTKLGEQALSDLFACHRSNVRRALMSLAAQHVIELQPNRGAFVATPSPEESREVFEARRTIERTLARLAIKRARPEDIAEMRRLTVQEAEARARSDKPAELRLSRAFHMQLAVIAGNSVLRQFLTELTLRTTLILGLYGDRGSSSCAKDEHGPIVDALEARDEARLVALIDEHLAHLEAGLDFDRPASRAMTLAEQLIPQRPL
ncbi:MAG: GntR family transcriptional regulator [Fulvimarina manganoxydans]|uniref:GntR family transcriptional regulator n=1 Tax=Fulvimarina manganoxydans TaxID=937218 RepID=UPI002357C640|nr:GntR family transcriptional regulator [Fulvimarina manganoxydans]MCK5933926.1 GntR family transcriptional regulator [Fulvimarina manganoxydans]